ncbi:MAG: AhpC/TSA family protein [Winogradskyella sp.]|uniref:peroxiredoxin-like family protein n=1 Tax=Winogradskyella sp. TaxID=1883156 RepID=UPI0017A11651|nr:AhpC/TSA family protein [Winogradskyella sp.]
MIKPRSKTPDLQIELINDTEWRLSKQNAKNYTLIVVYRGLHCPVCKSYLEELKTKLDTFTDLGVNVIAISSDTEQKAKETFKQWDVDGLPIGYEFSIEDARDWGLYISNGIKEEPEQFIEPGIFLIQPDQTLYCSSIQTMPFARPEFDDLIKAIKFVQKNDYPARGEA